MKRHVDKMVLASNGRVAMGSTEMTNDYQTAYLKPFDAFRDKSMPLAGEKGIEQLLQSGQLRRATQADYDRWQSLTGRESRSPPAFEGRRGNTAQQYTSFKGRWLSRLTCTQPTP